MLQIVIWMLCLYLVLKGVELSILADSAPEDVRPRARRSAAVWSIAAYGGAVVFFLLSLVQGSSVSDMPSLSFDRRDAALEAAARATPEQRAEVEAMFSNLENSAEGE